MPPPAPTVPFGRRAALSARRAAGGSASLFAGLGPWQLPLCRHMAQAALAACMGAAVRSEVTSPGAAGWV